MPIANRTHVRYHSILVSMRISCVLITHLPIKAEQGRRAKLRGKPVIITRSSGSKQVVLDNSPQITGVAAEMPLQEALSRCKNALLVQADEPYYHSVFDRVIESLLQRSPLVEKAELGCAYVGMDGLEAMYGGEARLVAALLQAVPSHLNARLGLANGKFPAYVAAMISSGGQATRAPDEAADFLEGFPIDMLPMSWDMKDRLHRFGLHTMGQVASLPVSSVQAQFGPEGKVAWELAHGIERSRLMPHKPEESVSEHLTFPAPATTFYAILPAVEMLLGRAFAGPALSGRYVRGVALEGRVLRKPPWTKSFAFKEPVNGKDKAFFALKNTLETAKLPGALEDITLTLSGLTGESGIQSSLFPDVRKRQQLREMMRQLEVRLRSRPPIYQVRDVEPWSRIPERRHALVPYEP